MNRRSFLKRAGAAGLAIVAAPLYIPAERLAFGVPQHGIAIATDAEVERFAVLDEMTVNAFVPTIWSRECVRTFAQQTALADLVDRSFEREMGLGEPIDVDAALGLGKPGDLGSYLTEHRPPRMRLFA
jgi:hypothetical protein